MSAANLMLISVETFCCFLLLEGQSNNLIFTAVAGGRRLWRMNDPDLNRFKNCLKGRKRIHVSNG